MFRITYQKRNGEVFYRIRQTIPNCGIGKKTSMGWKVLNAEQKYKNKYYSISESNKLYKKQFRINRFKLNTIKFIKKYATTILLFAMIPLYFFK